MLQPLIDFQKAERQMRNIGKMKGKISEKGEIKSMRKKILTLVAAAVMTMR